MSEINPNIPELYAQFKQRSLIDTFVKKFRKHPVDRKGQLRYKIEEELANQPGRYPLDKIVFRSAPPVGQEGFIYGFKQKIGEDTFNVDFWSYNEYGILVQKHEKGFLPQIEISKDEEGSPILYLPEGYQIPVGPIYFKEDSRPMTQQEWNADKTKVLEIAKAVGVEVTKETIEIMDKTDNMVPKIKKLARYFYWQPILEDETPTIIGIDFDAIKPSEMGLKLEKAPVFNQKIVITEEDLTNL